MAVANNTPSRKSRNRRYRSHQNNTNRHQRLSQHNTNNKKKYIVNLSDYHLSPEEEDVLSKGLNFAPSTRKELQYKDELNSLTRSYRLQHYILTKNCEWTQYQSPYPFKTKSNWMPPKASAETETYLQSLPAKFEQIPLRSFPHNITHHQRRAIRNLQRNKDIVIKKADKGSCVVIENTSTYVRDGLEHLSDSTIYEEIATDPTQHLVESINRLITTLHSRGYLDKITRDHLHLTNIRTQQMYFLKKIHKTPHSVRPIVSGCGGPTEKLSALMDHFLKPLVSKTESYTKDSMSIIQTMEELTLPSNCILVTIDVKALYLNIPHEEGTQACLNHLYHLNKDDLPFPPQVAKTIMKTVLEKNYFQFTDKMYHQVQGTAMGTKMAPSYANLFMDTIERQFLATQSNKPLLWRRYIDDILMIWDKPSEQLDSFLSALNQFHDTIKFTHTISDSSVDFLDITLHKGERFTKDNIMDIKPYFKSTNCFQYLHYSSAHPRSVFSGIAKGEASRILRASSSECTYHRVLDKLRLHLLARNYPASLLRKSFSQIKFSDRPRLLHLGSYASNSPNSTPAPPPPTLILEYNYSVTKKDLRQALATPPSIDPPRIAFRLGKKISNSIVRAKLPDQTPPSPLTAPTALAPVTLSSSSMPCDSNNCRCCQTMSQKDQIFSNSKGKHFKLPRQTNCNTKNVIYLMECPKCNSKNQYVGQTARPLKNRMSGHRAAFSMGKKTPLYAHFRRRDHTANWKVSVLEVVPDQSLLLQRENHWINTLNTRLPYGLNSLYS